MDNGIHFISGLPRSGSTLLGALLRQNPRFEAGISSPLAGLLSTVLRQMSQDNESSVFITPNKRKAVLQGLFDNYYAETHPYRTVFDTHRGWTSKMASLSALFPAAKVICCVRHVPWILDSLERLVQANPLEASKIFNFDAGANVFQRYEMVSTGTGMIGYPWNGLRDAFFGPHSKNIMLLTYETLVEDPSRALKAVYDFIGEEPYPHAFSGLEGPGYEEFDARLGTPGLHRLRSEVTYTARETILPPDLFRRVASDSFWLQPEAAAQGVLIV